MKSGESGMKYRAVIFDLGGVVFGSPLHAIRRYELANGIEENFVNRLVVAAGPEGSWQRMERGELVMGPGFFAAFDRDVKAADPAVAERFSAEAMMAAIAEESGPRPQMIDALRRLRADGYTVAALTNNWVSEEEREPKDVEEAAMRAEVRALFDEYVESSVVGLRKPDPAIYLLACSRIGVEPRDAVFLDDIGSNLKAARALGMTTIKVDHPDDALAELWRTLDGCR